MPQPPLIDKTAGTLILLLGQTGAGRSHFINVAAGENIAPVDDNLTSTSLEVKHYTVQSASGRHVILVDTPGFDHLTESDNGILERIAKWLKSYGLEVSFGGVIYLHDITQDRGNKTPFPVGYFSSQELLRHLLLTTTKWDRLSPGENYSDRESELERGVWKRLVSSGAQISRFQNTAASAWEVIDTLLALEPHKLSEIHNELVRIHDVAVSATTRTEKGGLLSRIFSGNA